MRATPMNVASAVLLAWRTLQARPRRTLLLLLGYGLGVAVMLALLAVGDALLMQARDKDVIAGGDVILIPEGSDPELLKVGGVSAMFLSISNARFLVRQVLLGPRYSNAIAAVSPEITEKLLYVRTRDGIDAVRASGALPSPASASRSALSIPEFRWRDGPEDVTWITPDPARLLATIDLFHRPPADSVGRAWAEWWYFNFSTPDGHYGYVTFAADGRGRASVSLAMRLASGRLIRWQETDDAATLPFDMLPSDRTSFRAGPQRADIREGTYHIRIRRADFDADLSVRPVSGLYFPPLEQVSPFRTGYVVPALRATVTGTIRIGTRAIRIDGTGYHDHNWGTWQAVTWEWGTASTQDFALLAGLIRHPSQQTREMVVTLYASDPRRPGLLSMLRGGPPVLSAWREGPAIRAGRLRIPGRLQYQAANDAGDHLDVDITVTDVLATPLPSTQTRQVFLQMRGRYQISGVIAGRAVQFVTDGFAETFVFASGQ
jgi:hypothetical protein